MIVQVCIGHLMRYGLNTVGIFRVSSAKRRIQQVLYLKKKKPKYIYDFIKSNRFYLQLREEFDRRLITSLDLNINPHDVAGLLKEYLRSLPEPLLLRSFYNAFLQTQSIYLLKKYCIFIKC